MIINRLLIIAFFSFTGICVSTLNAQTRTYSMGNQQANTQSRYVDQRQMSRPNQQVTTGKQAKVKSENRQLKDQLKHNQKEYKKLLRELERAQNEADMCNNYVASPTYNNSQNTAKLQNNANNYDNFGYEEEVIYDNFDNYNNNKNYSNQYNNTQSVNSFEPQNSLQEQQLKEIKELEQTLNERKTTQARQEAQLAELNKKLDALMSSN